MAARSRITDYISKSLFLQRLRMRNRDNNWVYITHNGKTKAFLKIDIIRYTPLAREAQTMS